MAHSSMVVLSPYLAHSSVVALSMLMAWKPWLPYHYTLSDCLLAQHHLQPHPHYVLTSHFNARVIPVHARAFL
jgi:hypothetical protein